MVSSRVLLDKASGYLNRLSVTHVTLDGGSPSERLHTHGMEVLLYPLVGALRIYAYGALLGTIGGRRSVMDLEVQCVRFPSGSAVDVHVTMVGFAADFLWVTCAAQGETTPTSRTPYIHWNDTVVHTVGQGNYQRQVAEVPRVEGYEIDTGETLNPPGNWSSYPPHATKEDLEKFANGETTWEEAFYVICEQPGMAHLHGLYTGHGTVNKVQAVYNGEAYSMPLGSHPIVAHPSSFLWYWWAYCGTALEKQYRKHSHDTGVYKK